MDGLISTGALPEPLRSTVNGNLSKLGSTASLRCAAHEYRMLAAGHCHVALYNQLTAWDHAAGWLLHREAGGYAARFDGSPYKPTHRSGGAARPTRAAGMPRKSADGRGFRGLGKLSGRVRPRPESHFPGLRLGLSLGVIPTICGQPYGKLCNSRKNPCRTRACINRSKPAAGWRPAGAFTGHPAPARKAVPPSGSTRRRRACGQIDRRDRHAVARGGGHEAITRIHHQ